MRLNPITAYRYIGRRCLVPGLGRGYFWGYTRAGQGVFKEKGTNTTVVLSPEDFKSIIVFSDSEPNIFSDDMYARLKRLSHASWEDDIENASPFTTIVCETFPKYYKRFTTATKQPSGKWAVDGSDLLYTAEDLFYNLRYDLDEWFIVLTEF